MKLQLLFALVTIALVHGSFSHTTGNRSPVSGRRANMKKETNPKKAHAVLETVAAAPTASRAVAQTPGTSALPWYFSIIPIYPKELAKFFSLSFMMFWIVFVFTMTRDTKDALIVTNCGAEVG
jgi:hypothetical protein